jgi:GTP-binding protein
VFEAIEKFSVVKTLQAIADANVVLLLIDATQGVSEQDAHIAGYILESGRAVVVAVNKWDAVDSYQRQMFERSVDQRLAFLKFAPVLHISAIKRQGLGPGVEGDCRCACVGHPQDAHAGAHPPAAGSGAAPGAQAQRRLPPQAALCPPGWHEPAHRRDPRQRLEHVTDAYKRFLEGRVREHFKLSGTPLRIEFKSSRNPFDEDKV